MRKSKPIKYITAGILTLACLLFMCFPVLAEGEEEVWPVPQSVETESVMIMELTTSTVLYEKDADSMRYPASTTKILTCLLALENSSMDEMVTFSERAVDLEEAASNIDAVAGETMSMKDCLYGLMLASGNDVANAIAEHIGGSIEGFADMMNERAAAIGCTGSHFENPSGLFGDEHYTTARDMALIAQEAYKNSTFIDLITTSTYTMGPTNENDEPRTFRNWNELINEDSDYYCPDVIGGKTGYLDESGRCLVTYSQRDNMTIITVQYKGEYYGIFEEARRLLDFTFTDFGIRNVSQEERRFSYTSEKADVRLDPAAQIIAIKNRSINDLDSNIVFAADAEGAPRDLYATINYSYAGHDLGSANVYKEKAPSIRRPNFIHIYNIHISYVIIFAVILALILVVSYFTVSRRKRKRAPVRARSNRPG